MAEAFLNQLGKNRFKAESAGLEPGNLNPLVVEVMQEEGIDISKNWTKGVFDLFKEGRVYNFVISVCDQANAERCPIFPGITKRLVWSFEDPSSFKGTEAEKLQQTRELRDKIKAEIENFINSYKELLFYNTM
jgi:arsenate reductase